MGWKAVSAYIMDLDMLRIRVIEEEMMLEILYISLRFVNHNLTAFQFCNGYWTGTCTLQGKACYITIGMWMYSWIKFVFVTSYSYSYSLGTVFVAALMLKLSWKFGESKWNPYWVIVLMSSSAINYVPNEHEDIDQYGSFTIPSKILPC